jgi:hypothetical protein
VDQVVEVAREALSGSIHDGFVFTLGAVGLAIGAALLMENIRLEEKLAVSSPEQNDPADGAALAVSLADALRKDPARSLRDEALVGFLLSIGGTDMSSDRKRAAIGLLGLANRIEYANGDYPNLVQAAAKLANGSDGDEHERAVHASKTIIRPLAESCGGPGKEARRVINHLE